MIKEEADMKETILPVFYRFLMEQERSRSTAEKYVRDVRAFFSGGKIFGKRRG